VEAVTVSVKMPLLNIGNKRMKRGGGGNPLRENVVFEDMKQEAEKGVEPVNLSVKMPFLKI